MPIIIIIIIIIMVIVRARVRGSPPTRDEMNDYDITLLTLTEMRTCVGWCGVRSLGIMTICQVLSVCVCVRVRLGVKSHKNWKTSVIECQKAI